MATARKTKRVLQLEAKVDQLKGALGTAKKEVQGFDKAITESRKEATKSRKALREYAKENSRMAQQVRKAVSAQNRMAAANNKVAKSATNVTASFISIGTAVFALQRGFSASLRSAISFDRVLVNIQKTTGLAGTELDKLREKIISVSAREGVGRDVVGGIAGVGGTLGLSSEAELSTLLSIITQLERATDLSATSAATSLTKIINLTGGDIIRDLQKVGDALVHVGNNAPTTEAAIADLGVQLSAILGRFGVDAVDVTGYAAALGVVEQQAAGASTAFNKLLTAMLVLNEQGGPQFDKLARELGRTTEQLGKDIQNNFSDVLLETLELLGRFDPVSQQRFLGDIFGLTDQRTNQALVRAAAVAPETVGLARAGAEGGVALTEENAARLAEASGRLDVAVQRLNLVVTAFGDSLLSFIDRVVLEPAQNEEQRIAAAARAGAIAAAGNINTTAGAAGSGTSRFDSDINAAIQRYIDQQGNIPGTNLPPTDASVANVNTLLDLQRERRELERERETLDNLFGRRHPGAIETRNQLPPTASQQLNRLTDVGLGGGSGGIRQQQVYRRLAQIGNEIRQLRGPFVTGGGPGLSRNPFDTQYSGARTYTPIVTTSQRNRDQLAGHNLQANNFLRFALGNDPSANAGLLAQRAALGARRISIGNNEGLSDTERRAQLNAIRTQEMLLDIRMEADRERIAEQKRAEAERTAVAEEAAMGQIEIAKRFAAGMTAEELRFQQRRAQLQADATSIGFMEDGPRKMAAEALNEMNQAILEAEIQAAAERRAITQQEADVEKELLRREAADQRVLTQMFLDGQAADYIDYTRRMQEIAREEYRIMQTLREEERDAALAALEDLRAQVNADSPAEVARRDTAAKHKAEYDEFGNVITQSVADSIRNDRSVKDATKHLWQQVAAYMLEQQIVKPFSEAISSILNEALTSILGTQSRSAGGFGGGITGAIFSLFTGGATPMARGGDVRQGGLALVGERGPEILSMGQGARITPLPAGGGMGGYSPTFVVEGVQDPTVVRQALQAEEPMMFERFKARLANETPNSAFSRRMARA